MAIIKLSKNEQRRVSVFFTCLVLAATAWVLTILSNPTPYKVKAIVNYTDLPLRRSFRSLQSDTIDATVQGTGWNMLFSRINDQQERVSVSLKSLDNRNYILLSNQLKALNLKRAADQQINSFDPDTLYFDFASRATKRVPVALQYKFGFKRQFILSDDIGLNPNYVTISGPADVIAKIKFWKTDSLTAQDLEDPIDKVVRLRPASESNISISPKAVRVHIPVSEFTEKTVEVPVKLINNKNYYSVKMFPQKVKVTFTVALNKYPTTDEHSFEAVADLSLWQDQGYTQLPVKVTVIPPYCKLVKIEPQNLDFIVKQ